MNCWKINWDTLQFWGVWTNNPFKSGSAKPGVVRSAPPVGAWGKIFIEKIPEGKHTHLIQYSLSGCPIWESPVGSLWLVVFKFHFLGFCALTLAQVSVCFHRLPRYQSHGSLMASLFNYPASLLSSGQLLSTWGRHTEPWLIVAQLSSKSHWST